MQAKKFIVPNMREGLKTVREVLGDDAMIISKRQTPEGIEIIAGLAQEPQYQSVSNSANILLEAQNAQSSTNKKDAVRKNQEALLDVYKETMIDKPLLESKKVPKLDLEPAKTKVVRVEEVYRNEDILKSFQSELESIREVLTSQFMDICWKEYGLKDALAAQTAKSLMSLGFSQLKSCEIVKDLKAGTQLHSIFDSAVSTIIEQIFSLQKPLRWEGAINVLIGAGGAGKTKALSKCLPELLDHYDQDEVFLISYNEHRVGQFDELLVCANIFNIQAMLVNDMSNLEAVLDRHADKKVIVIDFSCSDLEDLELSFECLKALPYSFQPIGVMATTEEYHATKKWLSVFKDLECDHLLATKFDEAVLKGQLFDLVLDYKFSLDGIFSSPKMTEVFQPLEEQTLLNVLRENHD